MKKDNKICLTVVSTKDERGVRRNSPRRLAAMKNIIISMILAVGTAFFAALGGFLTFSRQCEDVRGEVLRLHIPANSDGAEDQEIKLALRDVILEKYSKTLSKCENLKEAEETVFALLPDIENTANGFLAQNGFSYGAKAELLKTRFPAREYENFTLPAGEYEALRITLGSGEGQNWWCVIFPQLCLPAACENENRSDILKTFGNSRGITVKFALYDWLSELCA